MSSTTQCTKWKMPDANHWNGLCTNTFRRVYDANAKVSGDCEICVTPSVVNPPVNCNGCEDVPFNNTWPMSYAIRGGVMAATGSASGAYTYVADNATATITRYVNVLDWAWEEIADIFNGGVLRRVESSAGNPSCYWQNGIVQGAVYRLRGFYNNPTADATNCFTFWNWPILHDQFQSVGTIKYPRITTTSLMVPPFLQGLPTTSIATSSGYIPSFAKLWPSGFGVLTGTQIASLSAVGTGTPIEATCPSIGNLSGVVTVSRLDFSLQHNTPSTGKMRLTISVSNIRTNYTTFYNKTTSKWQTGLGPGFPTSPSDTTPAQPYGMIYEGNVDCDNRSIVHMDKQFTATPLAQDPLGYYPQSIILVGDE